MGKASGKLRREKVQTWDEASEVDQDQPKGKRSRRPPKSRDEGSWKTCQSTKITKSLLKVHKSTEPQWQSTTELSLSLPRSNELEKGGWRCQKMCPTNKSKAHLEAVYWDTLRSRPRSLPRSRPVKSYREAKSPPGCNLLRCTEKSTSKVYQVDPHSIEVAYRKHNQKSTVRSNKSIRILLKPLFESATMKSTGWSPKWTLNNESIPNTDDYRLQDILYIACGITAQSSDSASALELGKYNHLRETYMLDIDE